MIHRTNSDQQPPRSSPADPTPADSAHTERAPLDGTPAPESAANVIFLDHATVAAAFAVGQPLFDGGANATYQIHASRRDAAGDAEVHDGFTDIFYIQHGTGTLVTGGRLVEPMTTGPGEYRARAIKDGTPRRLERGDVIVVPAGVPHWFQQVDGALTYFTVKVSA